MAKNKKKKSKSHLLHLTHQMHQQTQVSAPMATEHHAHASSSVSYATASKIDDSHKYDKQFNHVIPDLKYFGTMVVMMAVILGVIYYLDSSGDFVLKTGKQIYTLLHLS